MGNVIASSLIGLLHLMLVNVSVPLKVLAGSNLIYSFFLFLKKGGKVCFSNVIFIVLCFFLLLVQFLHGLESDLDRLLIDFLALVFPLLFFLFVSGALHRTIDESNAFDFLNDVMRFIVWWSGFNLLLMYFIRYALGIPFNLTFGSPLVALAASLAVYNKRHFYFFACLVIALLSGKRSIMIFSCVCAVSSYFILLHDSGSLHRALKSIMVFSIVLSISAFLVVSNWNELVGLNPKLEKVEYLFSNDADMYQKSTGRTDEIQQAFGLVDTNDIVSTFLGQGLGAEFDIRLDKYDTTKEKNNIHFTPLNLYLKYGSFFFLIFYFYFFKISLSRRLRVFTPVNVYCFYYLCLYSLTSYGIVVDYTFWALMAILFYVNKKFYA